MNAPAQVLYATFTHNIGTPVSLGSNATAASPITITTGSNILAHDLVVIGAGLNITGTISSVTDGTNTYTKAFNKQTGNGGLEVWYCADCAAVGSGATITVSGTGFSDIIIGAARVAGTYNQAPFLNTSATPGPTIASGTLGALPAVLFGFYGGFNETAIAESSGFTNLVSLQKGSDQVWLNFGYKLTTVTTTLNYNPTPTGAGNNTGIGILGFA